MAVDSIQKSNPQRQTKRERKREDRAWCLRNGPRPSKNVHFTKMLISQVLKMPETIYGIPFECEEESQKKRAKQNTKTEYRREREREKTTHT